MHAKLRRFTPAVLGVLALGLVWAGLAWACTVNAHLAVRTAHGSATDVTVAPGTKVTLVGSEFERGEKVQLRWYTQREFLLEERKVQAQRGQLLGTTRVRRCADQNGCGFIRTVRIPEDAGGPHRIVASAYQGEYRIYRSVGVDVSGPERSETGGTAQRSERSNQALKRDATQRRGERDSSRAPGIRGNGGGGGGSRIGGGGGNGGGGGGGVEGASPSSGPEVFPGSVPPTPAAQRQGASPPGAPAPARGPSERSATGDLWSGFGAAKQASLLPSMTDPEVPEEGPGSQLAIGVGLLGLGLLALLSGFGAAEVRRRRALAGRAD